MIDINAELKHRSCSSPRGAQMGRFEVVEDTQAVIAVQRLIMVDGAYDTGGAYWGGSDPAVYCGMSQDGTVMVFARAKDRAQAIELILDEHPNLEVLTGHDVQEVVNGFLEAVLFAERDSNIEDDDDTSLEMANYGIDDFHPDSVKGAREDVIDFLRQASHLDTSDWDERQMGHDIYFSRNRHGTGFWDRGFDAGDDLHDIAKHMGSVYAYVDLEGLINIV